MNVAAAMARIDPSGTDAGKKVTGKKRHFLVDTRGLILANAVHPAGLLGLTREH